MSDLVQNERTKLLANALDRLSTACFAIGVIGQVLSLSPGQNWVTILSVGFWIFPAVALHIYARSVLWAATVMTFDFFFWYVLPLLIGFGVLGWMAYEKRSQNRHDRAHPGE